MLQILTGKAWVFGHDLDADKDIFPFIYTQQFNSGVPLKDLAEHVMEPLNPDFGRNMEKGDFVVVGRNFGQGKVHEQGIACMKILGVGALIADSISPSIFRQVVFYGLPLITHAGISELLHQDDKLEVGLYNGEINNLTDGKRYMGQPAVPAEHTLFPIMEVGGQIEYIRNKLKAFEQA
jgi:3-isopropylmalate/(R)-2-methylmalate dehydratase small subunit